MGVIGRLIFWLGLIFIVGHFALYQWAQGEALMAFLGLIFFPATYFIWPWFSGLWPVFLISLGGYWLSTAAGLPPVD